MMKFAVFTFALIGASVNAEDCTEVCEGATGPIGPVGPQGPPGEVGTSNVHIETLDVDNLIVGGNLAGGGLYINGALNLGESMPDVENFIQELDGELDYVYSKIDPLGDRMTSAEQKLTDFGYELVDGVYAPIGKLQNQVSTLMEQVLELQEALATSSTSAP